MIEKAVAALNYRLITIFPDLITPYLSRGILSRIINNGTVNVELIPLRDFAIESMGRIDAPITGPGRGMLFRPEPLELAIRSALKKAPVSKVIFLTPQGQKLTQAKVKEYSKLNELLVISARYEGIDQRIIEKYVHEEVSIGDYVLMGGELPALVLLEAIGRYQKGAVHEASLSEESFETGLLEHGHYTEPEEFSGIKVPKVLKNGDHKETREYRFYESLKKTYFNRHDLLLKYWPEIPEWSTKNSVNHLKKENKFNLEYLYKMINITKEWKNGSGK